MHISIIYLRCLNRYVATISRSWQHTFMQEILHSWIQPIGRSAVVRSGKIRSEEQLQFIAKHTLSYGHCSLVETNSLLCQMWVSFCQWGTVPPPVWNLPPILLSPKVRCALQEYHACTVCFSHLSAPYTPVHACTVLTNDDLPATLNPHTNIGLVYLPRLVFEMWSLTGKNILSAQTSHRCCLQCTCRALAGSLTLKWQISRSLCGSILLEERSRALNDTPLFINT